MSSRALRLVKIPHRPHAQRPPPAVKARIVNRLLNDAQLLALKDDPTDLVTAARVIHELALDARIHPARPR